MFLVPNEQIVPAPGEGLQQAYGFHAQSRVLVLDSDPECLRALVEATESLGYCCLSSTDPIDALQQIEQDPAIGILLTDLALPFMDGIALLKEVDARFTLLRPVVPIIVSQSGSFEAAVDAMSFNAVDFLIKPAEPESLSRALRRASVRRSQLAGSQLMAALVKAQPETGQEAGKAASKDMEISPDQQLMKLVRTSIRFRQQRDEYLDSKLFCDPAWDILLELTLAKLQGEPVPVSSACAAAPVPFTTAYRHIGNLVGNRMVRRWKDPLDQRRVLLELEDETYALMSEFLLSSPLLEKQSLS